MIILDLTIKFKQKITIILLINLYLHFSWVSQYILILRTKQSFLKINFVNQIKIKNKKILERKRIQQLTIEINLFKEIYLIHNLIHQHNTNVIKLFQESKEVWWIHSFYFLRHASTWNGNSRINLIRNWIEFYCVFLNIHILVLKTQLMIKKRETPFYQIYTCKYLINRSMKLYSGNRV